MRTILALLLVVFSPLACQTSAPEAAVNPALRDIEAFTANVVRTIPEIPSVAIAVVHDGKRHTYAAGFADAEKRVAATPQTGYYIGSTTKAFTGLTAAILANRGQIDLDAPLSKYLPEVTFPAPIDASRITLRRLLSHSAPITNHPIVFRTASPATTTPQRCCASSPAASPATKASATTTSATSSPPSRSSASSASRGSSCTTSWCSRRSACTAPRPTCPRRSGARWRCRMK